jgi:cytoskeletal protein CcmA (bactofilin family)
MVFRKDSKIDAFQRQISALRQQLGTVPEDQEEEESYAAVQAEPIDEPAPRAAANGGASAGYASAPIETRQVPAYEPERDRFTPYSVAPAANSRMLEPQPPDPYITPIADAQTSVIAHDTTWKGDLQSDGTIHVHGRVEGSIRAKQDVFVAEEADVDATITANNVVIAGLVKGSIRCGVRFEILPQGRVTGEVQAPTLVVHDGASVTGQFRMGAGEGTEAAKPPVVQRRAARGG